LYLENGDVLAIIAAETKKASESDGITLAVFALSGLMHSASGVVEMVGGIELTDDPIVRGLVEIKQSPILRKITNKLLKLQLWKLTKTVGINILHLKNRRLLFLAIPTIDQVVIKVKVERVPKAILNPQVLGLIIESSSTLIPEL